MLKIFKTMCVIMLIFFGGCSKEKKFTKAIQSRWSINKISTYEVNSCGGYSDLVSVKEDVGKFILTGKLHNDKIPYQTTDEVYLGKINYNDGTEYEFFYEYYEKLYGGFDVIFHFDGYIPNFSIEILTKNKWNFQVNNYGGSCFYVKDEYELSK